MKAIVQERYGSSDTLVMREVGKPQPNCDEVLVRVRAASLHPDVWHVVCGRPYVLRLLGGGLFRPKVRIPGTDVAGVVESCGRNVTRFRPGDAVFGETIERQQWIHGGSFAEYVSVKQHLLAVKPENVTFEQAASVPTSGFIALQNLRGLDQWLTGRRVLIIGAAGGVGGIALQTAKARGAHVTAVDSTVKLGMLRSLGADAVVDYTKDDVTRCGKRFDLVFDVPGSLPLSRFRPVLEPDGRYVPIGHERFGASGKRLFGLIPHFLGLMALSPFVKQLRRRGCPPLTKQETIAVLASLLGSGELTPIIDSTFPLSGIRDAFRHMIEDETLGKVVITP